MDTTGRNPLDLPPWIAAPFFAQPVVTYVTLSFSGPAVLLCKPDPTRWALWISANAVWFMSPDSRLNSSTFPGVTISQTVANQRLLWPNDGPLVQQAWYGSASGPVTACVISVSLIAWPNGADPMDDMMRRADRTPRIVKPPPLANVPGPPGRPSLWDYWMSLIGRKKPPV